MPTDSTSHPIIIFIGTCVNPIDLFNTDRDTIDLFNTDRGTIDLFNIDFENDSRKIICYDDVHL